nr:hypothetical protein CFP56_29189 [Quercus suber]
MNYEWIVFMFDLITTNAMVALFKPKKKSFVESITFFHLEIFPFVIFEELKSIATLDLRSPCRTKIKAI